MDIEKARQLVNAARADGKRFYSFDAYEHLVDKLYDLLECNRKEIDAGRVGVELVNTSTLYITGMKVLTILEPPEDATVGTVEG